MRVVSLPLPPHEPDNSVGEEKERRKASRALPVFFQDAVNALLLALELYPHLVEKFFAAMFHLERQNSSPLF